jgi:broad specificity phosphatase PhoE
MSASPLTVQLVLHGQVASHAGDMPVTSTGLLDAVAAGRSLASEMVRNEIVCFHYAPTRRARETALSMHESLAAALIDERQVGVQLQAPVENAALRSPDLYVAGHRIEMVSTAQAMAAQIPESGLGPEELSTLPFFRAFLASLDQAGYWAAHLNPPGEDANMVAWRLLRFAISLLDLPRPSPMRVVCVTHSPVLRAFLRAYVCGEDRGELHWLESVDLIFPGDRHIHFRYRDGHRSMLLLGA